MLLTLTPLSHSKAIKVVLQKGDATWEDVAPQGEDIAKTLDKVFEIAKMNEPLSTESRKYGSGSFLRRLHPSPERRGYSRRLQNKLCPAFASGACGIDLHSVTSIRVTAEEHSSLLSLYLARTTKQALNIAKEFQSLRR